MTRTGQPASWSQGDWTGDGVFDQRDIVAALQTGTYLREPLLAVNRAKADILGSLQGLSAPAVDEVLQGLS